MYLCHFCQSTPDHIVNGKCPNCGAPGPTEIVAALPKINAAQTLKSAVIKLAGYNKTLLVSRLANLALAICLGLAIVKPELRSSLYVPNILLSVASLWLNMSLNNWNVFIFAVIALITTLLL